MSNNQKEQPNKIESKRKFPIRGIFMQLCGTCLGVGSGLALGVELFSSERFIDNIFKMPTLISVALILASYLIYQSGARETSAYLAK